jgi:DNA-binding MarR family transcriptional regulator
MSAPAVPTSIDRLIHEPARLALVANLYIVQSADFTWLSNRTGLTDGNISSHMAKLEEAGYVAIEKGFEGKRPRTSYTLTAEGRSNFEGYRTLMLSVLG